MDAISPRPNKRLSWLYVLKCKFNGMKILSKFKYVSLRTSPSSQIEKLDMVCGGAYIPKDIEVNLLGQDAYFIYPGMKTFAVADGVGGWASKNIDAGFYARQLMLFSLIFVSNLPAGSPVDPKDVLAEGYARTFALGSSTACVVTLTDNILHAVNVGDSGFMVFREWKCVYASPVQQRRFNYPYQLGNHSKSNRPSDAKKLKVKVAPGDIIVAGTDGLFDNMFPCEIGNHLWSQRELLCEPKKLAMLLAEIARQKSHNPEILTPFSKAAKKARFSFTGGKVDDITVIVSCIHAAS